MTQTCAGIAPFTLTLAGVDAFLITHQPVAIIVGVSGKVAVAHRLVEQIEDACATLGYPREKVTFTPHLTLGGVQRDSRPAGSQAIPKIIERVQIGELGILKVSSVSIIKSELLEDSSVFTRIAVIQLGIRDLNHKSEIHRGSHA